jgi:hypothetical protein
VSVGLAVFGLFGALFVLTQFLQFQLGYTPLEAVVRMLPAAGAIALVAPLSSALVRAAGTKLAIATLPGKAPARRLATKTAAAPLAGH